MTPAQHNLVADLRGAGRLVIEGTRGVTGIVEAMHATIAGLAGRVPGSGMERTRGITGLVYRCIGGVTQLVGGGLEFALHPLARLTGTRASPPARETALGILNGVLGDHLAATGNPLAITMSLRQGGAPLARGTRAIRTAMPGANGRILVQVHGLCMSDLHWARDGHDRCAVLARERGYTPLQLHYNTGLRIADNGRAFAALLETLLDEWPVPVEEIAIVAHSMGGLVARSAHHHGVAAGHAWPGRLRKLVFLGTPHHGAPLERAGNGLDMVLGLSPYSRPFTRLGRIRSAGITDLRFGSLLDEDWQERDRYAPMRKDFRTPLPLPADVQCYAIAAVRDGAHRGITSLVGDGLVPVSSALGEHADPCFALEFPDGHRWVGDGLRHFDLLSSSRVFDQVERWIAR